MIQKVILVIVLASCSLSIANATTQAEDLFRDHIAPILERRCISCHNDRQQEGDLFAANSRERVGTWIYRAR